MKRFDVSAVVGPDYDHGLVTLSHKAGYLSCFTSKYRFLTEVKRSNFWKNYEKE